MLPPTDTHEDYDKFYSSIYKEGYSSSGSPANQKIKDLSNSGVLGSYGFKTVLEIGAGCGWLSSALARHGYDVSVTEICSRSVEDDLRDQRVFPYGAYDLRNFEDREFDCVVAIDVLDATRTKKESLCIAQEAARIADKCFICSVNGGLSWKGTNLQTIKKNSTWWKSLLKHHFEHLSETITVGEGEMYWTWHEMEK